MLQRRKNFKLLRDTYIRPTNHKTGEGDKIICGFLKFDFVQCSMIWNPKIESVFFSLCGSIMVKIIAF